jgi:predicted phage tail protein|tara:strand:+ start:6577 stop:9942 length:3366 start_codon:yes stop_codon:yes gene_type:complete
MTDEFKIIQGAGGGGPKPPPPPYRAPDTLHSRSFATVQDLISEGEIEGFASASKAGLTKGTTAYDNASLKDIFLNDTPILNSTASNSSPANTDFNFRDVGFKSRFGTSNQTAMSGIAADTRSPTGVGVVVTTSSPVTRQITNTDTNAVIVTLTWPQIQVAEDDGDLRGDTVEYKIQIQHDSGGFVDKVGGTAGTAQVSGRTADAYARDHRIELTSGFTTVDIRVVRVTADSTESNRVNAFQFTSFQEVLDNSSTYANSAYTALRFDSKQFDRIPSRKYRIRGIKVRIPGAGASGTGTPTVDIQTGRIVYPSGYVFNGVMGAAVYTNCPAMCLLDLLTNTRYGLGNHIVDSNIDLFSFVAASKYANEEVDDGTGSGAKEARFSCNVNIQSPKEAFAAINDLAGVMRCMPIWSAGGITLAQDKETSASYLFNLANVGEGGFSYSGSSLKTRNSVISVSYFNMDSKEVDFEVVEDATAISKFGAIVKKVKAFACTSRNQAARLGRAILFAEQNESETVSFTTSIDAGVVVRPGSVIEINDPVRAGARRGGRVVSATTTTVTIDALEQTGLPALNDNPTISVILSDGTVESKTITDITGAVLTVNSAFSSAPSTNAPYLISSTTLQTQLFRVVQVEEQDEVNYVITALSYVEGKYAFIENGTTLPTRTISILNQPASPPSNLTVSEQTVVINNIARSKLIVDWQPVVGVTQYLVNYKISNGNYVSQVVFSSDFELLDTVKATYTIQVFSYNALGEISANPTETTFTAKGKTAIPGNVQNLTIEPVNEQFVRLRFRQATALDVLHGGRVYVRHSNQTGTNATFQSSQDIIEAVAGNATEVIAPALSGTYLLKFQDDGGRFSAVEAKTTLSLVNLLDSVVVETDREDTDGTPYNGAKSNVVYDSSLGGLKLTDPTTNTSGTYDFVDTLDLGNTFSLTLKRHFQGEGFYVGDEFDNRTDNIDTWTDFDGSVANEANAKIAVRTTTDDPSGSPTYTDFNDFANGTFRARGFQFRITLETSDTAQNMNLQQAGYTATMQSRTEQSSVIASGAGAKAVTFTAPFFVGTSALGNLNSFLPSVNISAQNMASGDYFELSNISGTGFTVHFKNSSNASIDRNFTYSAVGFGKGG